MNYNMPELFNVIYSLLKAVENHVDEEYMTQEFQDSFMIMSEIEDNYLGEKQQQQNVFDQLSNFIMIIERDVKQIPNELQKTINEADNFLNDFYYDKIKIQQNDILLFNKEYKRI